MNVKILDENPYGKVICDYFASSFPKSMTITSSQLLDVLTTVLIGSKDTRLGSIPPPEQLVVIRKTISDAISSNSPIPILIPWGGRKLDKALCLDIAEVSALKQIISVDNLLRNYYSPGLHINVRIEDINAEWLYKDSEGIEEYSAAMVSLINMVKGDTKIYAIRESSIMSGAAYMELANMYSPLLSSVITAQIADPALDVNNLDTFKRLKDKGWQGIIPKEQRDYYLDRYQVMAPGESMSAHIKKLADYFAGSKVRYDLNGRANPSESFIQINFATPVPGAPTSIFNNTLYYRTVPMKDGRTHIAPWRSKGYLEIQPDNSIKVKVTNWGNKELIEEMTPAYVEMKDGDNTIVIEADYIVKDVSLPSTFLI